MLCRIIRKHFRSLKIDGNGWTFLETLIVLAVFLVLSGGISFAGIRLLEKARTVAAANDLAALSLALEAFRMDMGRYPGLSEGLEVLCSRPAGETGGGVWFGPYIRGSALRDPWGELYRYDIDLKASYILSSAGADGLPGGSGADTDIGIRGDGEAFR